MTISYRCSHSECLIYTYRSGVLTRLGHDLCLQTTIADAVIHVTAGSAGEEMLCSVQIDSASAQVRSVMREGHPDFVSLSAKDKRDIDHATAGEVLRSKKFPMISFSARAPMPGQSPCTVRGQLELRGRRHDQIVTCEWSQQNHELDIKARAELLQSQFGIEPYRALLGALKVADTIAISAQLHFVQEPAEALG